MQTRFFASFVVLGLTTSVACDPDTPSAPPTGDAGAMAADSGVAVSPPTQDAGTPAKDRDVTAYGRAPGTGQVVLWYPFNRQSVNLLGQFVAVDSPAYRGPARGLQDGCVDAPSVDLPDPVYVSAGDVTVSGGDGFSLTSPSTVGPYGSSAMAPTTSKPGFVGGESVRFTATGATVPSFDLTALFPLVLLLEAEPPPAGQAIVLPRTADTTLRWQRGVAGVDLYVRASATMPARKALDCFFTSTSGEATLPRGTLEVLGTDVSLDLSTVAYEHAKVGAFALEVVVWTSVHYAADRKFVPPIQLR